MPAESREEILQKYVGDMHGVLKHTLEVCERQNQSEFLRDHPEAQRVITRIVETLKRHHERVHARAEQIDALENSAVKEALTAMTGMVTGMYDKVRSDTTSKMLRDDYVALTMCAMAYEMLHTTALALKDQETAEMALTLMRDLPPIIVEIGHITPMVVVRELADKGIVVDQGVAARAAENIEKLWRTHSQAA